MRIVIYFLELVVSIGSRPIHIISGVLYGAIEKIRVVKDDIVFLGELPSEATVNLNPGANNDGTKMVLVSAAADFEKAVYKGKYTKSGDGEQKELVMLEVDNKSEVGTFVDCPNNNLFADAQLHAILQLRGEVAKDKDGLPVGGIPAPGSPNTKALLPILDSALVKDINSKPQDQIVDNEGDGNGPSLFWGVAGFLVIVCIVAAIVYFATLKNEDEEDDFRDLETAYGT